MPFSVVSIVTCIVPVVLLRPVTVTLNGLLGPTHLPECTPSPETGAPALVLVIVQPLGMVIETLSVRFGREIDTSCCTGVDDADGLDVDGWGWELEVEG